MKTNIVHSSGHSPVSQMSLHNACNSSKVVSPSFFNSSARMSPDPAALPFSVMALAISDSRGGGSLSSVLKNADSWFSYNSSQYFFKSVVGLNFEQDGVYFTYMGSKNPWADWAQILLVVGVHDVITPFKFGDDRFSGFGLVEGQSLPFSIYFEGRPYNTHTTVWGVICSLKNTRPLEMPTPISRRPYTKPNLNWIRCSFAEI